MRKFRVTVNNEQFEVMVEELASDEGNPVAPLNQPILETPKPVTTNAKLPSNTANEKEIRKNGQTIQAPLPGVVLEIKVNNGDQVTAGQVILILEAMKMENEITAPLNGTVKQIAVSKGENVNAGDLLITIE